MLQQVVITGPERALLIRVADEDGPCVVLSTHKLAAWPTVDNHLSRAVIRPVGTFRDHEEALKRMAVNMSGQLDLNTGTLAQIVHDLLTGRGYHTTAGIMDAELGPEVSTDEDD